MSIRAVRSRVSLLVLVVFASLAPSCKGDGDGSGGISLGKDISILVDPTSIVFPTIAVGQTAQQVVTIRHAGSEGTLVLTSVQLSATTSSDFSIEGPALFELEAGEETTVTVTYHPADNLSDSGELVVEHNALENRQVVRISALAQVARLDFHPNPIVFGEVQAGRSVDKSIELTNGGADRASVNGIVFAQGSSGDFVIQDQPAYPTMLDPGAKITFTVRYTPTGGDSDFGEILAVYTNDKGEEDQSAVTVTGAEVVPDITISPGSVDFGWVALDQQVRRPVAIVNEGSDVLVLQTVHMEQEHPAVTLQDGPADGLELAPGESTGFTVVFQSAEAFPLTTDPIATIRVLSNDPDENAELLEVYARIEAPVIRVTPEDVVDFGIVAQNFTTKRTVAIHNAGHAELEVTAVTIEQGQGTVGDEFKLVVSPVFPPSSAAGSGLVPLNETAVFEVSFTNLGPETGEVWGVLHIASNDSLAPEKLVNLHARRGGAPTCEPVLEPGQLNYGTVPHGATKTMTMKVKNLGSGNCSFLGATVSRCTAGIFGTGCTAGTPSPEFRVIRAPIPVQEGLQPGEAEEIEILYDPPDQANMFGFEDYAGLLQVTVVNPYMPVGSNQIEIPADGNTQPNLVGRSGISRISVLPDHIDFGLVTLGCYSQTFKVSVYNSGTAPLFVKNVRFDGCSPEFVLKSLPAIPPDGFEVTTAQPMIIEVVYHAQTEGKQSCTLVIESSDRDTAVLTVPLEGEGTLESHQVDEFVQTAGQEVDILFIVDNSGSMCEEQERLSQNFQAFINHAQTWDNDYQIGVVSTCVQEEETCADAGKLLSKFPPERWVDETSWPHFTENVEIGCNGGSDSQEAALEAAHMALTLPLSHLSDTTCGSNTQCQAPDECLSGVAKCGGRNGGFVREGAALEVVILSDEEDQSPATPDFYVDFFRNIKGFANTNFMHVHSIVGDKDRGCGDTSGSGSGTSAEAGDRYIYVSEATNGVVESICNDSFADALSEIGSIAFGLKVQFFLSRAADPSTLRVSVQGVTCSQGWVYDPPSNSVIFDENGSCMPQEGNQIRIEYDSICFSS